MQNKEKVNIYKYDISIGFGVYNERVLEYELDNGVYYPSDRNKDGFELHPYDFNKIWGWQHTYTIYSKEPISKEEVFKRVINEVDSQFEYAKNDYLRRKIVVELLSKSPTGKSVYTRKIVKGFNETEDEEEKNEDNESNDTSI